MKKQPTRKKKTSGTLIRSVVKFPIIMRASDYHEFDDKQNLLEDVLGLPIQIEELDMLPDPFYYGIVFIDKDEEYFKLKKEFESGKMKFKKTKSPITTSDLYYDLFESGHINPENILSNKEESNKVREAIRTIQDFLSEAESAEVIKLC